MPRFFEDCKVCGGTGRQVQRTECVVWAVLGVIIFALGLFLLFKTHWYNAQRGFFGIFMVFVAGGWMLSNARSALGYQCVECRDRVRREYRRPEPERVEEPHRTSRSPEVMGFSSSCPGCGYDQYSLEVGAKCPECGDEIHSPTIARMLKRRQIRSRRSAWITVAWLVMLTAVLVVLCM